MPLSGEHVRGGGIGAALPLSARSTRDARRRAVNGRAGAPSSGGLLAARLDDAYSHASNGQKAPRDPVSSVLAGPNSEKWVRSAPLELGPDLDDASHDGAGRAVGTVPVSPISGASAGGHAEPGAAHLVAPSLGSAPLGRIRFFGSRKPRENQNGNSDRKGGVTSAPPRPGDSGLQGWLDGNAEAPRGRVAPVPLAARRRQPSGHGHAQAQA